jgi:Ca2+/Na+ antiporter
MHDWLGMALVALGFGLVGAAVTKRRNRARTVATAGSIRPEFAAMGEIVRPMVLFVVALFAAKMTLFYFVLGGQHMLTVLQYGGVMFILAAYAVYLVVATTKVAQVQAPAAAAEQAGSGAPSAA